MLFQVFDHSYDGVRVCQIGFTKHLHDISAWNLCFLQVCIISLPPSDPYFRKTDLMIEFDYTV